MNGHRASPLHSCLVCLARLLLAGAAARAAGKLTPEWKRLFERYPDRFLLGSDTWTDERWDSYGSTMADYRTWLAQLPQQVAEKIAFGNAERLFKR